MNGQSSDGQDGGAGGQGGSNNQPVDFKASLPEDIRSHPGIKDYKDVPSLVKSHIELQGKLGTNPVSIPGEKATPQDWDNFYNKIGRPEKPELYKLPTIEKVPDGLPLNKDFQTRFLGYFHKHGLTQSQAEGLYKEYMAESIKDYENYKAARAETQQTQIKAMQDKYKDQYESNVNLSKMALKKFATEEYVKYLEETGEGDNPAVVEQWLAVGKAMLDDNARGGGGGGLGGGVEQGKVELQKLKDDAEFQKALHDEANKGHAEAVKRWQEAHRKATPNNQIIQPA